MNNKKLPSKPLRPYDAGGIYLGAQVALIMIQTLITIILGFVEKESGLKLDENIVAFRTVNYVMGFMTQLMLFLAPVVYSKVTNIDYLREVNPKRGISVGQVALLIVMALVCIVAFMPLSQLFIMTIKAMGYDYTVGLANYVDNVGLLILSIFVVALLPAICEEILYRGFFARGLRHFGIIATVFISAIIFATSHGNLLQLVYQFFLGLVLVTVYFATRSIYASITIHFVNNATALVLDYILRKTTGSGEINIGLEGAPLVFALIGISIAGCALLCLLMWAFLRIAKKKQDAYANGRTIDIYSSKVYGRHNKKGKNFITKYFDFLKYLNYSFEEEAFENEYKAPEQLGVENADPENMGYAKELMRSRQEKDNRLNRNLIILAAVYNVFLLIINISVSFVKKG